MTALSEWRQTPANQPGEEMYWQKPFYAQINFVDLDIRWLFNNLADIDVVSTHRSKSIVLPVYRINYKSATIIMRENFYGWVVSVELGSPIFDAKFEMFRGFTPEDVHAVYCEGFDKAWCYPQYYDGSTEFTVRVQTDYDLYAVLAVLKYRIDND